MRMTLLAIGAIAASLPLAAGAESETLAPERIAELSWEYSLDQRTLHLKACGPFRPGDTHQCAQADLRDPQIIEEAGRILRLPKDKVGMVIEPGSGNGFRIVGLSMLLVKAAGVAERAATGSEVQISGESLTEVRWNYSLSNRQVTLRVCGKIANPDYNGCAERHEKRQRGIRRLLEILLLDPVERLVFRLGWDAQARKFTRIRRISLTSR